jgi:hypothetical protein
MFSNLSKLFRRNGIVVADDQLPITMDTYKERMLVIREYKVEIGTTEHQLAQEALIHRYDERNIAVFTDDGDLDLSIFYAELCSANAAKIRKEHNKRLKV